MNTPNSMYLHYIWLHIAITVKVIANLLLKEFNYSKSCHQLITYNYVSFYDCGMQECTLVAKVQQEIPESGSK